MRFQNLLLFAAGAQIRPRYCARSGVRPARAAASSSATQASPPKISKIPSKPSNRARAIAHQRRQEQHAMDSSLLAAMASAGDESPGGDGMNDDGLRAPLGTGAREPTPWFDRAIGGGGPRAPLETSVKAPTSWSDRANSRDGLRARFESGETGSRTYCDRATGDDRSRRSTENSYVFLWALQAAIWCLDIMLDALQHIERRTRREREIPSPV